MNDQSSQVSLHHLAICFPVSFSFLSPALYSFWILTQFQIICPHCALLLLYKDILTTSSYSSSYHLANLSRSFQILFSPSGFPDNPKEMPLLLHVVPLVLYFFTRLIRILGFYGDPNHILSVLTWRQQLKNCCTCQLR